MDELDKKVDTYRAKLVDLVPGALDLLKDALTKDISVARMKAAELVLRGSRVIEDGRVLDALKAAKAKASQVRRTIKIRYTTPMVKDGNADS